jgi:serine/threonine protein phosphatase 1
MLGKLTKIFQKTPIQYTEPHIPKNQRVYCIGDIHGQADLLAQLHEMIMTDAEQFAGKKTIVYLGDYVDRGDQSRQVIDTLVNQPLAGFECVYLKGNHEQAMLDFIQYPGAAASWISFGGREALLSYGIPLLHIPSNSDIEELSRKLDEKLPDSHRDFMTNTLNSWQYGSYYFVHAGIRPGVPLENQNKEDQLWIRDDFLNSTEDHGAIVVHGHSIKPEPDVRPNRIGIDTGAFSTGVLTCLVLENDTQRFLQT